MPQTEKEGEVGSQCQTGIVVSDAFSTKGGATTGIAEEAAASEWHKKGAAAS